MVNSPRSAVAAAAIWLAAVVGVSATAWFAIDRAGRDITAGVVSTLPAAPLKTPTMGSAPAPATTPTNTLSPATVDSPTPTPATTPTPAATRTPTPTPRHRPSAPATPRDRTITVTGGLVSVRCSGAVIGLRIAQPENDWRAQVDTTGSGQITVSFRRGDEEEQQTTQVSAVCAGGTPTFRVNSR